MDASDGTTLTSSIFATPAATYVVTTSTSCTFDSTPGYAEFVTTVWTRADMCLCALLPSACLIVSNSLLLYRLAGSIRQARLTLAKSTGGVGERRKQVSSTTVIIITISLAFVVQTTPIMIYNNFVHVFAAQGEQAKRFHYFVYDCLLNFSLFNFSWNFYLYCLTGSKFRRKFVSIVTSFFSCKSACSNTSSITANINQTHSSICYCII